MTYTTLDWLTDHFDRFVADIDHERDQLARFGVDAADDIAELSHMVRRFADRLHAAASQAMDTSDRVRVGRYDTPPPKLTVVPSPPGPHRDELAAEVAAGEHHGLRVLDGGS